MTRSAPPRSSPGAGRGRGRGAYRGMPQPSGASLERTPCMCRAPTGWPLSRANRRRAGSHRRRQRRQPKPDADRRGVDRPVHWICARSGRSKAMSSSPTVASLIAGSIQRRLRPRTIRSAAAASRPRPTRRSAPMRARRPHARGAELACRVESRLPSTSGRRSGSKGGCKDQAARPRRGGGGSRAHAAGHGQGLQADPRHTGQGSQGVERREG